MQETPQPETQAAEPVMAATAEESLEAVNAPESLPERQYCVFRAGRERFCLAVLDVEEVVDWPAVTPVPLAPSFLMGIFNLRGSIVPVVDIAFTVARRADLTPKRVVVANLAGEAGREDLRLGIAADEVIGTYSTSEPLLVEEAPRDVPHCCGMLRHPEAPAAITRSGEAQEDRLALALDLKRLLEAFPVGVI